jgi:hypothetical protein
MLGRMTRLVAANDAEQGFEHRSSGSELCQQHVGREECRIVERERLLGLGDNRLVAS